MIKEYLHKIIAGVDLEEDEAQLVMEEIMSGRVSDVQIASLLTGLRIKGETVEEITGFARGMRNRAISITSSHGFLVDTCGTGGDGSNTFNISTAAALVLAGAGAKVAKHGNRSVSSQCGSAQVLTALGVNIDLAPETLSVCLDKIGIAFLYAPILHQAMKRVATPRQELGFRTLFNILGPLTNPARVQGQVVGVFSPDLAETMGKALQRLGVERGFVVHGSGGLDEVSLLGPTLIKEIKGEKLVSYFLYPEDYGMEPATLLDLAGGSPEENGEIIKSILAGKKGPPRDIVLLNSALGLMAANLAESMDEGLALAQVSIDQGYAQAKLQELISYTTQFGNREVVAL